MHGIGLQIAWAFSTALIWVNMQYYTNEVFALEAPAFSAGFLIFVTRLGLDLINDLIALSIDKVAK